MTLTGLLRIVFRLQRVGLTVLGLALLTSLVLACTWPLKYEAQIIIEREPTQISYRTLDTEFDVTRFTSENQRTIALLKSRYLMQHWLNAVGIQPTSPKDLEQKLKKLTLSLVVKPINFTDLYLIKVQAKTPAEAARRAEILTRLFGEWDAAQVQQQTQQLTVLLKRRLQGLSAHLASNREQMKREKLGATLNLSGSTVQGSLETSLRAQQELYGELTNELEKAERQVDPSSSQRIRIVVPVTASQTPVRSRGMLLLTALLASLFVTIGTVLGLEWQDRRVYRAGDIYKSIGSYPVVTLPLIHNGAGAEFKPHVALGPVIEAIRRIKELKGSAVIQVVSPGEGDGKTKVCEWLHASCQTLQWHPVILGAEPTGARSLDEDVRNAQNSHDTIFLELALPDHAIAGSNMTQLADINCCVISAGKTSCDNVRLLEQHLKRFPHQLSIFVLNRWSDPLPARLRI